MSDGVGATRAIGGGPAARRRRARAVAGHRPAPTRKVPDAHGRPSLHRVVSARTVRDDWNRVHLAVNIFIATTLLWLLLPWADLNPIWAISSMVAARATQS